MRLCWDWKVLAPWTSEGGARRALASWIFLSFFLTFELLKWNFNTVGPAFEDTNGKIRYRSPEKTPSDAHVSYCHVEQKIIPSFSFKKSFYLLWKYKCMTEQNGFWWLDAFSLSLIKSCIATLCDLRPIC